MPKSFIKKHNIPLFKSVSDEDLDIITEKLDHVAVPAGGTVIKEGEPGDCLYLIEDGQVKVVAKLQDTDEELILSKLEAGDYFGEMSLITGEVRSASVIAEEDSALWKLSKKDFDDLIQKHPDISLTLTHMLSQRLKSANRARQEAEAYYKERFIPHGKLQDTSVISLLKYIEDNSLTGELDLTKDDQKARFSFKKGQLEQLSYKDKDEIEAMDEILQWSEGEFVIKPGLFQIESLSESDAGTEDDSAEVREEIEIETTPQEADPVSPPEESTPVERTTVELFRDYFKEKIGEFNQFAGLQVTKNALRQSYHKFENYFDVLKDIEIESAPEVNVLIRNEQWSEKHTLFSAILLRDLITTIERDVIGIEFWSPASSDPDIEQILQKMSFFEYYDQATDFIRI